MLNAIIIDDEENNIINLQNILQKNCLEVNVVGKAMNTDGGIEVIKNLKPDLVFLDIQMPDKNGFELLQSLPNLDFEVIFVTAYDQYGIQAVKFSALDYLLKPIKINELQKAVAKAVVKSALKKQNEQLQNLVAFFTNNKEEYRLALPSTKETRFVTTQQILRCESINNYTVFYLLNKEKITVAKPIYEYDEMLHHHGFVRCHQSHLVNKKFIKSWIREDGDFLLLEEGTKLPISKLKKASIKEWLR